MKQTQWVSDEVWSQLDPRAGSLNRNQRRKAVAAASVVVALLMAGFAVDRSGFVRAQVEYAGSDSGGASPTTKFLTRQVAVKNTGWTTVRVTGVGENGPGLRLVKPGGREGLPKDLELPGATPPPFDLHPGQTVTVEVAYQITDCAAVPSDSFPIALRVDRPWGTQTVDISLPMASAARNTDGVGPDTDMIGWQKAVADDVCDPTR